MPEGKNFTKASEKVKKIIDSLTDSQRKVLEKRFGKIDKNTDLNKIGLDLEAIRRKIKRIEAIALRKIRNSGDEPPDDIA